MATLKLFDIGGKLLACGSEDEPCKIQDYLFDLQIQVNGFLRLCTSSKTDTRAETYKKTLDNVKNELSKRKEDLALLEKDITTLLKKIEEGGEGAKEQILEMGRMVMLKGQHKKRISELRSQTKVSVTYKQILKTRSALLPPGVFTKLPWFPKPIMWCSEIEEKVEEKVLIITEEMANQYLEGEIEKGHLYAIGGYNTSPLSSVERYIPNQKKWVSVSGMNCERSGPGVAVICGQLYAAGGQNSLNCFSSVERYDPIHNKWSDVMADMISKRAYFSMAVLDGQLYVVGGFNGYSHLSSVERYDPGENKWVYIAAMNSKRANHGTAVLSGQLYVVGGNNFSTKFSTVERYDPDTNRWDFIAEMNSSREGPGVAVVDGLLYAVGGFDGCKCLSSVERYDPDENKWIFVMNMVSRRRYLSAAAVGGQLYALGGYCNSGYTSLVERYDPQQNKWTTIQNMTCQRARFGVIVIAVENTQST